MNQNTYDWEPTFINVEQEFDNFVNSFRSGKRVSDIIQSIPPGCLNADYFFESDDVIAELKCLESDPTDGTAFAKRVAKAYSHFGYSGSDAMGYLFRGEEMPENVAKRLRNQAKRPIVKALEKANKQIRSTKILLERPRAWGLALIANDNNFGISPAYALEILSNGALNIKDRHIDGIVYFTPNVYHNSGEDIARQYWIPVYEAGREEFSDLFVNDLGRAWLDHLEKVRGPSIERFEGPELPKEHWAAVPDKRLQRDKQ